MTITVLLDWTGGPSAMSSEAVAGTSTVSSGFTCAVTVWRRERAVPVISFQTESRAAQIWREPRVDASQRSMSSRSEEEPGAVAGTVAEVGAGAALASLWDAGA